MRRWDLGALARAAGSELVGGPLPVSVGAVGTDTRSLPPESLFVALCGERFDAHAFVRDALARGAVAAVVERRKLAEVGQLDGPLLVVDDTLQALGDMAAAARHHIGGKVVAVTGSNGKTTSKEMLASVLGERGRVHKTAGNLNNLIGLPLTVFAWPEHAFAAVLEMGMSFPGEIARLTDIAAPDVGLITMVGPAHLEGLGSLDNIGRAKGELFVHLPADSVGVVNIDDPIVRDVALPLLGDKRRVTFGTAPEADVRLLAARAHAGGVALRLSLAGSELEVELPLVGPHNAMNAAGAAAAAYVLGLSADEIARGLAKVQVPGGRLRVVRAATREVQVVDDTYNANPASMRAAFATLASIAEGEARRVVVLGGMLELGSESARLHREVGAAAAESGVARVFAFGVNGDEIMRGAQGGGVTAEAFTDMSELCAALDRELRDGDFVLIKGSRGMRMERAVQHLVGAAGEAH